MRARRIRKYEGWSATGIIYFLAILSIVGLAVRIWMAMHPMPANTAEPDWLKTLNSVGPETYITVLAIVISFYAIYMQIRETHRINKFNQSVVTTMHCNSRYDEIVRDQPLNMLPSTATDADTQAARKHWRRYWGLKADQFDLYLTGLVDRDTMASWQLSIIRHFLRYLGPNKTVKIDKAPGGMNALDGWKLLGRSQNEANLWFSELVEKWLAKAEELAELTPAQQAAQKPEDLLIYVVEQLAYIEPLVESWSRSSHHGNMPLAFYRASLDWKLFPGTPRTPEQGKYLEKLKNGVAITPSGTILTD